MLKYLVSSYYYYKLKGIPSKNRELLSVQVCFWLVKMQPLNILSSFSSALLL